MSFFRLLLFSCGTLNVVYASSLIVDTLRCSRYWPQHIDPLDPQFKLPETLEYLDHMCRWHQRFFDCVRNVSRRTGDRQLPDSVKRSENISKEICQKDFLSKRSYVETARCVNRLERYSCSFPGMDDKYKFKSDDACDRHKKAVGCFAISLYFNCDINAFNIFLNYYIMLHWEADDCDFVTPEFMQASDSQYYTYLGPRDRGSPATHTSEDGKLFGIRHNGVVFIPNRKGDVPVNKNEPLDIAIKTALDLIIDYVNDLSDSTISPKVHGSSEFDETLQFFPGKQSDSSISDTEQMLKERYKDYNNIVHLLSNYDSVPPLILKESLNDYPVNDLSDSTSSPNVHESSESETVKFLSGTQSDSSISDTEQMVQKKYRDYNNIVHYLLSAYDSVSTLILKGSLDDDPESEKSAINKNDFTCGVKPLRRNLAHMIDNSLVRESAGRDKIYPEIQANIYESFPKKTTSKQWINESPLPATENTKNEYCSKDSYLCLNDKDLAKLVDSSLEESNDENSERKFLDYRSGTLVDMANLDDTVEKTLNVPDESYVRAEDMNETDPPPTDQNPSNVFIATENANEKIQIVPDNIRSELVNLFSISALDDFKIVQQPNLRIEFKPYQGFSHIERITCERVTECVPVVREVFTCSIIPRDIEKDHQNEISSKCSHFQENPTEQMIHEKQDQTAVKISDLADYIRSTVKDRDEQIAYNPMSKNEKESETGYESDSNVVFETPEVDLSTESDNMELYFLSTDEGEIQQITEDSQLVLIENGDDDQPEFVYSISEHDIPDSDDKRQPNIFQSENKVDKSNESL